MLVCYVLAFTASPLSSWIDSTSSTTSLSLPLLEDDFCQGTRCKRKGHWNSFRIGNGTCRCKARWRTLPTHVLHTNICTALSIAFEVVLRSFVVPSRLYILHTLPIASGNHQLFNYLRRRTRLKFASVLNLFLKFGCSFVNFT